MYKMSLAIALLGALAAHILLPQAIYAQSPQTEMDKKAVWTKSYCGEKNEFITSIISTPDGGALLGGYTTSNGANESDIYLLRVDADGNMLWEQSYGANGWDVINAMTLTADGGALLGGFTESKGTGSADMYLVRVDADGNILWDQRYGESGWDHINSITLTADGGALLGGHSWSFDGSRLDMYLVRVDSDGNMLWDQRYGGSGWESIRTITLTPDGGVLLGGITERSDGDGIDAYLVRVDSDGKMLWDQGYGGYGWNEISSIALTADGGALLGGGTDNIGSNEYDAYLIKIRSIAP